jgi:hypothetical protein
MHFLCMSWCLTGGRRNLGEPGLTGGEYLPSLTPDPFVESPPPKQQSSVRHTPRRPFLLPWPNIGRKEQSLDSGDCWFWCKLYVMHYDNKNQGDTRLMKTIDWLNIYIYFGRLCLHQELHYTNVMILMMAQSVLFVILILVNPRFLLPKYIVYGLWGHRWFKEMANIGLIHGQK